MRCLAVLSLSAFATVALAANVPSHNQTGVRMRESKEASALLHEIRAARRALRNQDNNDARTAINDALQLQSTLAKSHVRLIPVYQETVTVDVFSPSRVVASAQNQQTDETSADRMTTPPDTAVQDVFGKSTRVFLNTEVAGQHLENAKKALNAGDIDKAESELAAARQSLVTETHAGDEPLAKARANLMIAGDLVGRYLFDDAVTSLNDTIHALETYANDNGRHAVDARVLGREIALYEQRMPHDPILAAARIQQFWDTIANWTSQPQKL